MSVDPGQSEENPSQGKEEVEAFKYNEKGGNEGGNSSNNTSNNTSGREEDGDVKTERYSRSGSESQDRTDSSDSRRRENEDKPIRGDDKKGKFDDVETIKYVPGGGGGRRDEENNRRDDGRYQDSRRNEPRDVRRDTRRDDQKEVKFEKYSPGGGGGRGTGDRRSEGEEVKFERYKPGGGSRGDSERRDDQRDNRRDDKVEAERYKPGGGSRGGSERRDDRRDNRSNGVEAERYKPGGGGGSRGGSERRDDRRNGVEAERYKPGGGGGSRGGGGDAIAQYEQKNPDEGYGKYKKSGRGNYSRGRSDDRRDGGRGGGGGGRGNYSRDDRREGGGVGGGVGGGYSNRSMDSHDKIGLKADEKNKIREHVAKKRSIEELQDDPLNPLSSKVKTFEDIEPKVPENILKGLQAMGFNRPSSVQGKTIPVILSTDNNIVAQSQSGTGKTACFAIGVLEMVDPKLRMPQVVIISPTMELAEQNSQVIQSIGKFVEGVTVCEITKGKRFIRPVPDQIVCGTPGKIKGFINRGKINTKNVRLLVLDEADAILETRTNSLRDQTEDIKRMLPRKLRIFLFSATFEVEDDGKGGREYRRFESREDEERERRIRSFANEFVPDPKVEILVPKERLTLETMAQYWVATDSFSQKVGVLKDMYAELTIGQSIVFINTKRDANFLKREMCRDGHVVSILHSEVPLFERRETMVKFRKNESKILITTNVLARGVDVPTVTIVINFDLPINHYNRSEPEYATYLHRIGRTARFGGYGTAVTFVNPGEEYLVKKLEKYYKTEIMKMTSENLDKIEV